MGVRLRRDKEPRAAGSDVQNCRRARSRRPRCATSVPIPKFAHPCGRLECELRNQRDTSQLYDSSAAFESEVRKRTCGIMCANFGFAALPCLTDTGPASI